MSARSFITALALVLLACGGCSGGTATSDADADVSAPDIPTIGDTGDTAVVASAPVVTIVWPPPGETVAEGIGLVLSGRVSDSDDAVGDLEIRWTSSLDGLLAAPTVSASGVVELAVDLSVGTHTLSLRATDGGGQSGQSAVDLVVNGPPTAPVLAISPAAPRTTDDLTAATVTPASDPNRPSGALTLSWEWLRDGVLTALTGKILPAAETSRGETWRVRVRVFDGLVFGAPALSEEVTIVNTPPSCGSATLLPSAATAASEFTCACQGREDADGDPAQDTCTFRVDGLAVGVAGACTLPAGTATAGSQVLCTVVPGDGFEQGAESTAPAASVLNALPPTPTVALTPAAGGLNTFFTCKVSGPATDADGDALTHEVVWRVGAYDNPGTTTVSVMAGELSADDQGTPVQPGAVLRCIGRAFDGKGYSAPAVSEPVVLANSPPSGGSVAVTPAAGTELTTLTCQAQGAVDPDGTPVNWLYEWLIDDAPLPGAVAATLTGASFDRGDVVSCRATPSDGTTSGPPVASKNKVTISNTQPTVAGLEVSPQAATQTESFVCEWGEVLDPDPADVTSVVVHWEQLNADGTSAVVAGADTNTLAAAGFPKGTSLVCVVTPSDQLGVGAVATSAVVTVANTPPVLSGVAVTPSTGSFCSTFVCEVGAVDDADPGDVVLVSYRWAKNGQPAGESKKTLAGVSVAPGDSLQCFARGTDGEADLEGEPIYGTELASAPVVVGNTPPAISGVDIAPANPTPESTLTCTALGYVDAEDCTAGETVVWKWFADGGVVAGLDSASVSAAAWNPGTEVTCQGTPTDGFAKGVGLFSETLTLSATTPVVAISAPSGAAGAVSCDLVTPASPSPLLVYTWMWSINGGAEMKGGSSLGADAVDDCDRVSCRAVASYGGFKVESLPAVVSFGAGPDCDDSDPCTYDECLLEGGCQNSPHSDPCEDGNPCTIDESCDGGLCGGGVIASCDDLNICTTDLCNPAFGCEHEATDGFCGAGGTGVCFEGLCCQPSCEGKVCGDDGCGGVCGQCQAFEQCDTSQGQCIIPTPGMTLVPGGGFWMGCGDDDPECDLDEGPLHALFLQSFEIDIWEVSHQLYGTCVAEFGCPPVIKDPGCSGALADVEDHPVDCIDWYTAEQYCLWADKRLCTEAEWEKAARGPEARTFPWGNTAPSCAKAVYSEGAGGTGCGTGATYPIGALPGGASPYGAMDMAGNVFEWVSDRYGFDYYKTTPKNDPQGPETGTFRVRRGGDYQGGAADLRTSSRRASTPVFGSPGFGIRCCRSLMLP